MADRLFEGEEAVLHVIERIMARLGLRVDATSPWVDARLPDGSRAQTGLLNTWFPETASLSRWFAHDSVEMPALWNALQLAHYVGACWGAEAERGASLCDSLTTR